MMASIYQNPLISDTLVQIYERMKNETSLIFDETDFDEGKRSVLVDNIMSLKVAAEMSV